MTGYNFAIPLFGGFGVDDVRNYYSGDLTSQDKDFLLRSGLQQDQIDTMIQTIKTAQPPNNGKFDMFDGRTGDKFDQAVSV